MQTALLDSKHVEEGAVARRNQNKCEVVNEWRKNKCYCKHHQCRETWLYHHVVTMHSYELNKGKSWRKAFLIKQDSEAKHTDLQWPTSNQSLDLNPTKTLWQDRLNNYCSQTLLNISLGFLVGSGVTEMPWKRKAVTAPEGNSRVVGGKLKMHATLFRFLLIRNNYVLLEVDISHKHKTYKFVVLMCAPF